MFQPTNQMGISVPSARGFNRFSTDDVMEILQSREAWSPLLTIMVRSATEGATPNKWPWFLVYYLVIEHFGLCYGIDGPWKRMINMMFYICTMVIVQFANCKKVIPEGIWILTPLFHVEITKNPLPPRLEYQYGRPISAQKVKTMDPKFFGSKSVTKKCLRRKHPLLRSTQYG